MSDSADTPLNYCDQRTVPEWGTGPDGRPTRIAGDARLPGLFREWQADTCTHPGPVIAACKDSMGRDYFNVFCSDCGKCLRSHLPHGEAKVIDERHPDDFRDLNARYTAAREKALDRIASAAAERMQPGNRANYDDYLRSDAWKRRAAKVMQRAGDLCEGCLTNPPTEVHHRTYENLGAEFAFELLALCDVCHNRIHARKVA